jgi:hypothetical protein
MRFILFYTFASLVVFVLRYANCRWQKRLSNLPSTSTGNCAEYGSEFFLDLTTLYMGQTEFQIEGYLQNATHFSWLNGSYVCVLCARAGVNVLEKVCPSTWIVYQEVAEYSRLKSYLVVLIIVLNSCPNMLTWTETLTSVYVDVKWILT